MNSAPTGEDSQGNTGLRDESDEAGAEAQAPKIKFCGVETHLESDPPCT